jgi:hypothetical protein
LRSNPRLTTSYNGQEKRGYNDYKEESLPWHLSTKSRHVYCLFWQSLGEYLQLGVPLAVRRAQWNQCNIMSMCLPTSRYNSPCLNKRSTMGRQYDILSWDIPIGQLAPLRGGPFQEIIHQFTHPYRGKITTSIWDSSQCRTFWSMLYHCTK